MVECAVEESLNWTAFAEEDPSAQSIADEMQAAAERPMSDLEAIAHCAVPHGERDCIVELRADVDQISSYQASNFLESAEALGLEVTLHGRERYVVLEIRGWLAMGHFGRLNGHVQFEPPSHWFNADHLRGTISVKVYPLWEDDPWQHINPADLQLSVHDHHRRRSCCGGPGSAYLHHIPTGIKIEIHAYEREHWLREKAMQMLKSQLRWNAISSEKQGF